MRFSVIIPTYQRPRELARCIEGLAQQTFPKSEYEIIVVDDASQADRLEPVLGCATGVARRLLSNNHCGAAAARNAGAAVARGRFLAFLDDDCRPAPEWLACLDRQLARTMGKTMVGGLVINELRHDVFASATQALVDYLYLYFNSDPQRARLLTSNNCSVAADEFRKLGGFDSAFRGAGGEDRDFCRRWEHAGNRLVYAPEAIVYHAHASTLASYVRQHFAYGRGSAMLRRRAVERGQGAVPLEPKAFYWNLVRHPFRTRESEHCWLESLLLVLSQFANNLGYLSLRLEQGCQWVFSAPRTPPNVAEHAPAATLVRCLQPQKLRGEGPSKVHTEQPRQAWRRLQKQLAERRSKGAH